MFGEVDFHSGFVVRIGSADIHETITGFPSSHITADIVFFIKFHQKKNT